MRLIRMKQHPPGQFTYKANASVTTQASIGTLQAKTDVLGVLAKMILEVRFVEQLANGVDGEPYIEIQLSVEGAFATNQPAQKVAPDTQLDERTMAEVTKALVQVADVHLRQVMAMADLPFSLKGEVLVDLASGMRSQPVNA